MSYARFNITATRERRRHHRRGTQQPQNQVMLYPLDRLEFSDRLVPLGWRAIRVEFSEIWSSSFWPYRAGFCGVANPETTHR